VIVHATDRVTLHHGDALDVLRTMAPESVDCCITSPPYYGLRDYGMVGQLGAESTPIEYVENLRAVFAEVRRVLATDGTLWLNLGDTYAPTKAMLGIPWRTAFRLADDGWIIRNAIVWHKPNGKPDPVKDRLAGKYELFFMFSRSRRYWFDLDAIREEPIKHAKGTRDESSPLRGVSEHDAASGHKGGGHKGGYRGTHINGRNPGDVWSISTHPFPAAHFATFPPDLPRRAVLAGCRPGGVVLDPFTGAGTTGMVAGELGRRFIGIDLSADYLAMSLRTRLANNDSGTDSPGRTSTDAGAR
jgi:site-specific DNA-methyltransferase (cytosine-N4-specific)